MGRGIVEYELFRSERYGLEERTADPAEYADGEMWIRTDLAPETDQLATLRFDKNGTLLDVPIFDTAASTDAGISKAFRVSVGGVAGFIPLYDGGSFDALKFQHNSAVWELHDSLSGIPDSEVLDDWADSSTVSTSEITDRQTFDALAYQGPDPSDTFEPVGSRPVWTIHNGSASISSNQLSLSASANLSATSAQNRGVFRANATITTETKGSFYIFTHTDTPSAPTTGNGYAIQISYSSSIGSHLTTFMRFDSGTSTNLIQAENQTDTTLSVHKLTVDDTDTWTYELDGVELGTVTDATHLDKSGVAFETNPDRDDGLIDWMEVYPLD